MSSKRILVIESEEDFAQSLVSMFSSYDAEVNVIADGKQGLQEAKANPPDLILLCVELPKMSGYSICNKLKKDKKLKAVPLVIMSSEATEETFEQHKKLKTRAEDYIIKPFQTDELTHKLSALIELPVMDSMMDSMDSMDSMESLGDEELISIEDDEAITIDEDDAIVIDDLPDLEDEKIDLEEDDSTVVMESPVETDPELDKLNDVFEDLQMDGEGEPETDDTILGTDEDITGFDDVLDSLKEVEAEVDSDTGIDEDLTASEDDLDLTALGIDEPEGHEDVADLQPPELDPPPDVEPPELVPPDLEIPPELEAPPPELVAEPAEEAQPLQVATDPEQVDELQPIEEEPAAIEPEPAIIEPEPMAIEPEPVVTEPEPPIRPEPKPPAEVKQDPVLLTRLQNAEEENRMLRDKVATLEKKLEEMHHSFEKRESELGSLRTKTTSKDKEFLAVKATINAKDRDILDLKEEANRKDQEILDVQEQMAEREQELSRIQEMVAARDREIKEQSNNYDNLLRQKNDLEETHSAKMAEWDDRYTTDTAKLEHQIQVMKEEHQQAAVDADAKIAEVEERLKSLRSDFEDTKQRHSDEVFGLRTRYKNEIDKLEAEVADLSGNLESTQKQLEEETAAHEETRTDAARLPDLERDLEEARNKNTDLEQQVSDLKNEVAEHEDRVVKAYQKIKNDEKIKEKARKAVEIAFTLLAEQVSEEEAASQEELPSTDSDEAHT